MFLTVTKMHRERRNFNILETVFVLACSTEWYRFHLHTPAHVYF
jgi:predicted PhzF superfamily epimerase YddE/YHI9